MSAIQVMRNNTLRLSTRAVSAVKALDLTYPRPPKHMCANAQTQPS